ncbi:MORN repeat-containing protein [Oceanivirga salmonicida]|uniref:hypothetical protein n=1 Tax=Oceanivirga salmonicida TaxID=1769291 RepID=UPI000836C584|nr:hypothetical protein [Oceanivirga salmonicida]
MKKIILLLITVLSILSFSSKVISEDVKLKNGVKEGKYIITYDDSKEEGIYVRGKKEGLVTRYWNDGIIIKFNYKNGEKDGIAIKYNADGSKRQETTFNKGEFSGKITQYFENGDKQEFTYDKNGELNGKAVQYNKDGSRQEFAYLNGIKHGKAVIYFGDFREEFSYNHGVEQGSAVLYYKDGKLVDIVFDIYHTEIGRIMLKNELNNKK